MNTKLIQRILKYILKYKLQLIMSLVCAILSVAASLAGPMLIGNAIDNMAGKGLVNFSAVIEIIVILALIYIVGGIFGWLLSYLANKIAYKTVNEMRCQLFNKLSLLPLSFFDNTPRGDTISRFVNDMDTVSDGIMQTLSTLLTGIVTIIGAIALMLRINLLMTLVVLLSVPITYFTASFITKRSQKMFREQAKSLGRLNGYIEEIVGGQKVVKAFNYEHRAFEQFREINNELYQSGVKSQFYSSLTNPSTRLVNNITYAVVGTIGSIAAILKSITVGGISSFLIYSSLFAKPFNEITGVLTQLQAALASAQRVFDVLDRSSETEEGETVLEKDIGSGNISFNSVSFSYKKDIKLITNLSLDIKKGSRIAIVGQTGAGKTTLVNLLMRFYDVDGGSICIDGININTITRDSLRRNFGMVLQDTWLFEGSIRDNIAYGKPDASDEEIITAAKAAEAHSFIRRLPEKYDTIISDSGESLSQGQKQLLTIARVILVDPPMLILDEATSNIDTRTEIHIQRAFQKMTEGRTSFVIAHRLSTIMEADLILVMDRGNIVESGTHKQLLSMDGYYSRLYNSQFEAV